jgi:hypothetical protein
MKKILTGLALMAVATAAYAASEVLSLCDICPLC